MRNAVVFLLVAGGCPGTCAAPDPPPAPRPMANAPRDASSPADPGLGPSTPATVPEPEPTPERVRFPDGTRAKSCGAVPSDMACVPGGPFLRGTDDGPENARPQARVWIGTFHMDRNEITYAQYRGCARAGQCPDTGPRYRGYDYPNMPITGISWYDAVAYCQAQGKRLPTEAEWEKAARGPDGALYPWGDAPVTCELAVIKDARGRSCGVKKDHTKPETGRPWDVGSRAPGVYGLYDMVGNSWEWVADWYASSYEACGEACTGIDPKGPCGAAETCRGHGRKIVRGGSWYWPAAYNTAVYRRAHVPKNDPFHHFGFRCARDVE